MNLRLGILGLTAFLGTVALGSDHFMVIGGGPTPQTSQLSIEQNVIFLRRALKEIGRPDLDPVVFFASGKEAVPDVCYDRSDQVPRVNRLLAEIFGAPRGIQLGYRCHEVGDVRGATSRANIVDNLTRYSETLRTGDRLFLYVSGHGGKGDPTSNGYLETWRDGDLRVKDLGEILDKFAPEVEIIVVMVQCYSGAFANILFEGGDPTRPLAKHRRAGFFATIDSRPAAGCTPDTKVENYHEYTTSFLAALSGRDRTGNAVAADDIDGNGQISMAEAHAYSLIHSPTIDVCYRTSDRLLETIPLDDKKSPASTDIPLETLTAQADPVRKHVLLQLAEQLKLPSESAVKTAREEASQLVSQRRRSRAMISTLEDSRDDLARKLEADLRERWPFLQNPWHPETHGLLSSRSEELMGFLESRSRFRNWERLRDRIQSVKTVDLERERRWAKLERFTLTARSVARADILAREGNAETNTRYRELLAIENQTLAPPPSAINAN